MTLERSRFYPLNIEDEKLPPVPDNFWGRIFSLLYERWGDPFWWPGVDAWEVAVGAILTQNTAWTNVEQALQNLRQARITDCKSVLSIDQNELAQLIRPSGYFNQKARKLKELAGWWNNNVNEDSQFTAKNKNLRAELLNLWGIGPETADSISCYAFGKPVVVVDAYTTRMLQRLNGTDKNLDYDSIQKEVHKSLPANPKLFNFLHGLIVILAKEHCTSRSAKCTECPLSCICKHFEAIPK